MTDGPRRQPGTAGAVIFLAASSCAGAVLLFLAIPFAWAIAATVVLAAAVLRLAADIRGNRAM